MPVAQLRLLVFGAVVLGVEIIATVVAIVLNLPAQFGEIGTDAGSEFAARGTAISPPIAPLVILAGSLLLLRRRDRWATVGCVIVGLLGVLFAIGSIGEAAANGTPDVAKVVLVGSGVVGSLIGGTLVFLAVSAVIARSRGSEPR